MAVDFITALLDGTDSNISPGDFGSSPNDTQIVTLLDDHTSGYFPSVIKFDNWGTGSPSEPGEGPGGDDRFIFDLSGFDEDFHIIVSSLDEGDTFQFNGWDTWTTSGYLHTFTYTGTDDATHTVTIDAEVSDGGHCGCWCHHAVTVVCFARGTRIAAETAETPIEDLSAGDLVRCLDGTLRPIRWIGSRKLSAPELAANPHLYPIRIGKDALGSGLPCRDLRLSPAHRVLLQDWRAELLCGEAEVLTSAKSLLNDSTITRDRSEDEVEYFHILLDRHDTLLADGLPCESLMPATLSLAALDGEARSEILLLFPQLAGDLSSFGTLSHVEIKRHEAQALMSI